jgi:hypothetical protein
MSRSRLAYALLLVVAVAMLASTSVRANDANPGNIVSTTLSVSTPVTLGGTSLQPGTYTVKADDTKVTIMMNGKTVAQANVQWKDEAHKSPYTNLLAESGSVKEIHFSGKTRYVEITN